MGDGSGAAAPPAKIQRLDPKDPSLPPRILSTRAIVVASLVFLEALSGRLGRWNW